VEERPFHLSSGPLDESPQAGVYAGMKLPMSAKSDRTLTGKLGPHSYIKNDVASP
jgi:hypothetical protein